KERFDRLIVDSKLEHRQAHLHLLQRLVLRVEGWDQQLDGKYEQWRTASTEHDRKRIFIEMQKLSARARLTLPRFGFQRKIIEELATIAANLYEQFQTVSKQIADLEKMAAAAERDAQLTIAREKMSALERFVRMPWAEYGERCEKLKACTEQATHASSEMVERN